jgi:L-lactate dehydrogenase (cytochrome)/(S)-mandelate dehydrogenase
MNFPAISVNELRDRARRRLPAPVFDFVDGGAEDEIAIARNRHDLREIQLTGRVLGDSAPVDTSQMVWGTAIGTPLIVAPMGACGLLWPEADVLIAQAATRARIPFVLATFSNRSLEDVAKRAGGRRWFQLYPLQNAALMNSLVFRAARSGYEALVVTVDVAAPGKRERDARHARASTGARARRMLDFAVKPGWCAQVARHGLPEFANLGQPIPRANVALQAGAQVDPGFDWDALRRIRDRWPGRLVVKGVQHADDAQRLWSIGVDGVWASNHGGRQLDCAPSTPSILRSMSSVERGDGLLIADSGFRRGSDVLKGLTLGANLVGLGRSVLYGVAAGGAIGAYRSIEIISEELRQCMRLCGLKSLAGKPEAPFSSFL